jgi:hypothetical protein
LKAIFLFVAKSSFYAPHQMLPFVRELLQLLLRANLMLFYFEGDPLLDSLIIVISYGKARFLNLAVLFFLSSCRSLLSYIQTCCRHSLCVHRKSIKSKTQVLCFEAFIKSMGNQMGNFPSHLSRISFFLFR